MIGELFKSAMGAGRLIKDSGGVPSWAHTLAIPFTILTMLKWLIGGFALQVKGLSLTIPPTSAGDTAILLGVWLAYLGQRDYVQKKMATNGSVAEANAAAPTKTG